MRIKYLLNKGLDVKLYHPILYLVDFDASFHIDFEIYCSCSKSVQLQVKIFEPEVL